MTKSNNDFSNLHVVIIDDDDSSISVLEVLLRNLRATYTSLVFPDRAIEIMRKLGRYDVVFLDLDMPKVDGYKLLARIKSELGNGFPVVAYTSHTAAITHAKEAGFDGFIGKPIEFSKFPGYLSRIVSGNPVWVRSSMEE